MDKQLEYSSGIKDMPFLFLETRRTARLLCEGKNKSEIIELSLNDNIFQLTKERRRKELPTKILNRLISLDENLLQVIANGNEDMAKLLALLAIIKTDKLFFEFMRDVYNDKFILGQMEIAERDFVVFFKCKTQESEKIAKWKQGNLEKIRSTYKKILCEAGVAKKTDRNITINKAICDNEILQFLKSKEYSIYAKLIFIKL